MIIKYVRNTLQTTIFVCRLTYTPVVLMVGERDTFTAWGIFDNVQRYFQLLQLGRGARIYWVKARDAGKHPIMHKAPHNKVLSGPKCQ